MISTATLLPDAASLPVPATLRPIDSISFEDIEWIGKDLAAVTWQFIYDSVPRVSLVSYEFEAADPSVGYAAGVSADGDCPQAVIDRVAENAYERICDDDSCEEYEHEDRYDYEPDADDRGSL